MWNAKRDDIETKYRVACFRYHSSHVSADGNDLYSPIVFSGTHFTFLPVPLIMEHKCIQAMFDRSLEYRCCLTCMSTYVGICITYL